MGDHLAVEAAEQDERSRNDHATCTDKPRIPIDSLDYWQQQRAYFLLLRILIALFPAAAAHECDGYRVWQCSTR
jgi:hypothetical protein